MNRDKLIDTIRSVTSTTHGITNQISLSWATDIADHLIANGIGDITAEKCRADRASEEAYAEIKELKEFQLEVSTILGTTREPMLKSIRMLKHRAEVAEEALRELIAEMYENGIRPICNQEMLYETRLEQAEQRLKGRV